ncbi:uncharacterized protein LOC115453827 [Manduca sexta]|uniref:uncharacterized protein LOC115453827 n=1 Tax=Manduca sexta TaxID=7130 RepID=UPI0018909A3D|nr:uncharacterized protein LOC115453827 [Manduca sexta]
MTTSCLMNMSPHFYIVYFLICVKWSICYEYYERDINLKRDVNKSPEVNQKERPNKINKNPNAEFDLASFLNIADEVSLGGRNYDYNVKSEYNSKGYNEYGSVIDDAAENIKKRDDSSDFFNGAYSQGETNMKPLEPKNVVNSRQSNMIGLNEKPANYKDNKGVTTKLQDELSFDRSLNHHPEKKCSFKNMKFPFFSHNKSQTRKKAKKRKMFCLNCKKKDAVTTSTEVYEVRNKNKRSYVEKLCPECQQKFKAEINEDMVDEKRRLNQRMIHNSRQYFAAIDNEGINKPINRLPKTGDDRSDDIPLSQYVRRKRDKFEDRDRRLQELDLIQKKVDNVEIHMPRFGKPVQV